MNLFSKENLEKESFKGNFCRTCLALIPAPDLLMALAALVGDSQGVVEGGDTKAWGSREGAPCSGRQLAVPWGHGRSGSQGGAGPALGHLRAVCRVPGRRSPGPSCLQTVQDPCGLQGVGGPRLKARRSLEPQLVPRWLARQGHARGHGCHDSACLHNLTSHLPSIRPAGPQLSPSHVTDTREVRE